MKILKLYKDKPLLTFILCSAGIFLFLFLLPEKKETRKIISPGGWKLERQISDYDSSVSSVALSPDGKQILSGSGYEAKVRDFSSGKTLGSLEGCRKINAVAYSPDGSLVALASGGFSNPFKADIPDLNFATMGGPSSPPKNCAKIYSANSFALLQTLEFNSPVLRISF
jgi:WD40 repeat protein